MAEQITIGGPRLGSGKKMDTYLHGYERSNHNLSEVIRTTVSPGTLVPIFGFPGLPGDTFDIEMDADVKTHPTIGPLFGSFKLQIDTFIAPYRLIQPQLQMNRKNIGRNMKVIYLPQIVLTAPGRLDPSQPFDNQHINPSCILSHMGIRGLGHHEDGLNEEILRSFNASQLLFYWLTYGQYYCNKQEEIGVVIHKDPNAVAPVAESGQWTSPTQWPAGEPIFVPGGPALPPVEVLIQPEDSSGIAFSAGFSAQTSASQVLLNITVEGVTVDVPFSDIFNTITPIVGTGGAGTIFGSNPKPQWVSPNLVTPVEINEIRTIASADATFDTEPQLYTFPLENLDLIRDEIMAHIAAAPYEINSSTMAPFGYLCEKQSGQPRYSKQFSQEGLAIKTYQSDIYNNWLNQEWIDGVNGITELTAVDVSGGSLILDELNMAQKIYNVLARIALSDGSYDAWQKAVYDHARPVHIYDPVYIGGLQQEVVFEEVISNAASQDQPLGTLAGRGRLGGDRKGGKVVAKFDEPGMVYGILSLTPRIDYSQGNEWYTRIDNLDEFHKPALDGIGYQDLVTDQMAWWDTAVSGGGGGIMTYRSAGKQPAWLNYMTSVNKVRGNFAEQNQQMFMVLTRRYEVGYDFATNTPSIADLTTYIDPTKYNHIFADTRLDAQNFWVQVRLRVHSRRKMSAKQIPNL